MISETIANLNLQTFSTLELCQTENKLAYFSKFVFLEPARKEMGPL